jgi:hypothetical protein
MDKVGMRLCHLENGKIDWIHLLEMKIDDVDLTELDDANFEAYVRENFKDAFLSVSGAEK